VKGQSFEDMIKAKYPGIKYHTLDTSKIDPGLWRRSDYPFEDYFEDTIDSSVLDWQPTGAEPSDVSKPVQARMNSTIGKNAIVVPPALQERMDKDPALAKAVLAKVDAFIAYENSFSPNIRKSFLIALDDEGKISNSRVTSEGGYIIGPSEQEQRAFEAYRKEKQEKREEYEIMLARSAFARKQRMDEQQKYIQNGAVINNVLDAYNTALDAASGAI
jgi:hypothetical protein